MIFTRRNGLACLLALQLMACSSTPEQSSMDAATAEALAAEQGVNPYLLEREPVPKQAQQRFDAAVAAMADGEWAAAKGQLLQLTASNPELSGPWLNLAITHRELGDKSAAVTALEHALTANDRNLEAYNQLAALKRDAGDFAAAELLYQQALATWPDHAPSHLNLGILYDIYMGKFAEAAAHYQAYQALREEPDRRVAGWLADIKRRPQMLARSEQTQ